MKSVMVSHLKYDSYKLMKRKSRALKKKYILRSFYIEFRSVKNFYWHRELVFNSRHRGDLFDLNRLDLLFQDSCFVIVSPFKLG